MGLLEVRKWIACALLVAAPSHCDTTADRPSNPKDGPSGCPQDATHNVALDQACGTGATCVGSVFDCDRAFVSESTCTCIGGTWSCIVPKPSCERVCGGVAVDISSDPHNCGACGHDCLGTGCVASRCQPVALASDLDDPHSIAVDGTNVYWASGQTVMKCALTGCANQPTVLASSAHGASSVAVDATDVYWAQRDTTGVYVLVMKCATGGCSAKPTLVAQTVPLFWGIALGATDVYWTTDSLVQQCSKSGCGAVPTMFAGVGNNGRGIALNGTSVYWATLGPYNQPFTGQIMQCPVAGCNGAPTILATGQDEPTGIAVDASNVYWITGAYQNQVMRCATSGCTPTALASAPTGSLSAIAVDAKDVYWAAQGPTLDVGLVIVRCGKEGCGGVPSNLVWEDRDWTYDIESLAVDDTAVYWIARGYTNGQPRGRVMKVIK